MTCLLFFFSWKEYMFHIDNELLVQVLPFPLLFMGCCNFYSYIPSLSLSKNNMIICSYSNNNHVTSWFLCMCYINKYLLWPSNRWCLFFTYVFDVFLFFFSQRSYSDEAGPCWEDSVGFINLSYWDRVRGRIEGLLLMARMLIMSC